MNDVASALKDGMAPYSALILVGMMVLALTGALVIIGFGYRAFRAMHAVKRYDAACERVKAIEEKMSGMKDFVDSLQRQCDKEIADAREEHSKELFELQQIIFERNSEILDLKNRIMQLNKSGTYEP